MGMWALWAAIEVEPHSLVVLNHRVGSRRPSAIPRSPPPPSRVRAPFAVCWERLAASGHVGGRFTVGRHILASRYAMPAPEPFEAARA